jgi:hypothetical protein
MIWVGLVPICISINFQSIGVHFFLIKSREFIICLQIFESYLFQFEGFGNVSIQMILKRFLHNLKNCIYTIYKTI